MFKPINYKRSGYKILLPVHVYHKMLGYALASEGEISGFGKVRKAEKNGTTNFQVTEVRIFRQIVDPVHTRLHQEHLAKFIVELANEDEDPSKWNCWWHSHNDFGAGFSGEDETTINGDGRKKRGLCANSSLISVCINKMGDLAGRYDMGGKNVDDDVPVIVEQLISPGLLKNCREEVKKKVEYEKVKPFVMVNRYYSPTIPRRDPYNDFD